MRAQIDHVFCWALLLAVLVILAGSPARAQLIKDINTTPSPAGSSPDLMTVIGDVAYFSASDALHGRELWRSDGTSSGTWMVRDINPYSGCSLDWLTGFQGNLIFAANEASYGYELYKSDGTADGTVLLKDISPGATGSAPYSLVAGENTVHFFASTSNAGVAQYELWRTDGTSSGTVAIKGLGPASYNDRPESLVKAGANLFFFAWDPLHGKELWKSDGTNSGTLMVKDINAGTASGIGLVSSTRPSILMMGSDVYFWADDGVHGLELWKSDGTTSGTVMVKDIYPGPGSCVSMGQEFAVANGALYFIAGEDTYGLALWKSDGTEAGTVMLYNCEDTLYDNQHYAAYNGLLYFNLTDKSHGRELWQSDGTTSGTKMFMDICPGSASSAPQYLTALNGLLYFWASDGTHGYEVWVSDGSEGGTIMQRDINSGSNSSLSSITQNTMFVALKDMVLFPAANAPYNGELWRTSGASAIRVTEICLTAQDSSNPSQIVVARGRAFFSAETNDAGVEPYISDGAEAGTKRLADINPGAANSNPNGFLDVNNHILFSAFYGGSALWEVNPTSGTVWKVKDILSFSMTQGPNLAYFCSDWYNSRYNIWQTDGTGAGTTWVANPPTTLSLINNCTYCQGSLYFTATATQLGNELWKYHIATGQFTLVCDINPGSASSSPKNFTSHRGVLYFSANDGTAGIELWRSDGSAAGTVLVRDIYPGPGSSSPNSILSAGGSLFFSATDPDHGQEPWISGGTADTTRLIGDLVPGVPGSNPLSFIRSNTPGAAHFTAWHPDSGVEIWHTDGTAQGTKLYYETVPGAESGIPLSLAAFGEKILFSGFDPVHGRELWGAPAMPIPSGIHTRPWMTERGL